MIILKHLTVERFRLLRELNLHFPQRGSILIQGPNESGKSALLESLYFALYGEPLATNRGKRSLDDLILYGATSATVTLTLLVGATELTVARTIERGAGQKVILHISRLGMPAEEPVTELEAANERIIAELGRVDGKTLRDSSFIEQKGLGRLEDVSGAEREATIRKLLGLEKLLQLKERFTITGEDEQKLKDATERLHLAEIQARIPEVSKQLEEIEIALDAINVREKLEEIKQQEADIDEQEQTLEEIKTKRLGLKSRVSRAQQLQKADATLADLVSAYDEIAEADRELPELEKQIIDLERREREELPTLEKRVSDFSDLTRSFGTLERMSSDLLTVGDTIRELELELRQHDDTKEDLKSLEEQVAHARSRLNQAKQSLQDLEERRRAGRPQLEARLDRLKNLAERLKALSQLEDQYARRVASRDQVTGNRERLNTVRREHSEAERKLSMIEPEAMQVQQQADIMDQYWRRLSVRRQIEEWHRLKGLSDGLNQAEQHLNQAHMQMTRANQTKMSAQTKTHRSMFIVFGCVTLLLAFAIAALFTFSQQFIIGLILSIFAFLALVSVLFTYQQYTKTREEEQQAEKQLQEATNRVSMMVVAREAATRTNGNPDALNQIENEIRSLGVNVPRSLEEAQQFLEQTANQSENIAELQRKAREKGEEANVAKSRMNATMEAVTALRKERAHLEALYKQEDWDNIEGHLQDDQAALERMHQEVTLLSGQEGLPLASINMRLQKSGSFEVYSTGQLPPISSEEEQIGVPDLESMVDSTIKDTERELASLEGKLDLVTDLAAQIKIHQEALDVLLTRQKTIEERNIRYQANSPLLQIERAREQQTALRQALQSLTDSLRQRVKVLGVAFGHGPISGAEAIARQQLESLQITLGSKLVLQEKRDKYVVTRKEHKEALPELYSQLAKYSNVLGSWIVPLNPFAEALVGLRSRCQKELEEINEPGVLAELETLRRREGASEVKIELCRQEIEIAQEGIAALLVQRSRPQTKSYVFTDLAAVWPLLNNYTVQDRSRLEDEYVSLEQELSKLEEQELTLSTQLDTGSTPLDLQQERSRKEQQERSYLTKKHGNKLIDVVNERLLQKMVPRTEYYMQQILPLLTSGRYHDVHLTTEVEEGTISGGPLQLLVWDSAAGEYVPKSALSGGASDQLSLALRLAFAIATLPRELSAAPGFVILDEPLSSFDRTRTQSLVNVVTGDILSQHFEQVVLISHSSAFDPAMFPYHVYMDNGLVVESNLPVVPEMSPITSYEFDDDGDDIVTMHVSAVSMTAKAHKE